MENVAGALFGLAYGDALGKATEFEEYAAIVARHGVGGPTELAGWPALVTDDTQMTLAVGEAMIAAGELTPASFEPPLRQAFLDWAASPDNNRAPGMTCLRACAALSSGVRWQEATQLGSKGCGANMRVVPLGLDLSLSEEQVAGGAQLQAGLTHGHPTGLVASELTAFAVRWLLEGLDPRELISSLRDRCAKQRGVYRGEWLGDLWEVAGASDAASFIARGWDETDAALARIPDSGAAGDPCLVTGAGWIAEEALATALYCYLRTSGDPVAILGRAAATSGDSDSIACLAGAFAGAAHGLSAWPSGWADQIEYGPRLRALAGALA